MLIRVEIFVKPGHIDPAAESIKKTLISAGYKQVKVEYCRIYFLEGDISKPEAELIAQGLLTDPLNEESRIFYSFLGYKPGPCEAEIAYNPGVMDPVSKSVKKGIVDILGKDAVEFVRTAKRVKIIGIEEETFPEIIKILFNPLIEHIVDYKMYSRVKTLNEFSGEKYEFQLKTIDILNVSSKTLEEAVIILDGLKELGLKDGYSERHGE